MQHFRYHQLVAAGTYIYPGGQYVVGRRSSIVMSGPPPPYPKLYWPELVGVPATPVVMKIKQDRPDVAVEVLPPGAPLTPEFNPLRVRVFIGLDGLVAQVPIIG